MEQSFSIEKLDSGLILTDAEGKRNALVAPKDAVTILANAFNEMIKGVSNSNVKTSTITITVEETP